MSTGPEKRQIAQCLRNVIDPCSAARGINNDIVAMGLLKDIEIDGKHVTVHMRLTTPACLMVTNIREQIQEEVGSLPGVDSVSMETDGGHNWRRTMMSPEAKQRRKQYLERLAPLGENNV